MKKLINLFLLLICLNGLSQRPLQYKNIAGGTYQFIDNGFGLNYTRLISNYGIYGVISKGNYWMIGDYTVSHFKATIGVSAKLNPSYKNNPYFSFGIAYHEFWGIPIIHNLAKKAFNPFSAEFGISENVERVNVGVRYDVFKNEAALDIGILF